MISEDSSTHRGSEPVDGLRASLWRSPEEVAAVPEGRKVPA